MVCCVSSLYKVPYPDSMVSLYPEFNNGLTLTRSSFKSLSLHTIAGSGPIEAWSWVTEVLPFPNIKAVGGPLAEGNSLASTVDLRRRIASVPESKRAELATLAAHKSGSDSASQALWSRLSPVIPRRASSSATVAAKALAPFLALPL